MPSWCVVARLSSRQRRLERLTQTDNLYLSGYWPLNGNRKRSNEHYRSLLPQTLRLLHGSNLLFYSSSQEVLDWVEPLAVQENIAVQLVLRPLDALPAWDLAALAVKSCEAMALDHLQSPASFSGEKGVIHYWRDFKASGPDLCRKLMAVWLSKVALVAEQASSERFSKLTWVDSSMARFNHRRSHWRFWLAHHPHQRLSHYRSEMRCWGRSLPLNASYLSGPRELWPRLQTLFERNAALALQMPYGHDEETILAACLQQQPELFHPLGVPYKRLQGHRLWKAKAHDQLLAFHPKARHPS